MKQLIVNDKHTRYFFKGDANIDKIVNWINGNLGLPVFDLNEPHSVIVKKINDDTIEISGDEDFVDIKIENIEPEITENKNIMEKKTIKMKELEGLIIESVQEVLQERKEKKKLNEDVSELMAAIVGPAALGGATYGVVKLVDALEAGKFGEKGKTIAAYLRTLGNGSRDARDGSGQQGFDR